MSGAVDPCVLNLLSALSDAIGQALALDANGECALEFEGAVELVIAHAAGSDVLSVRSALTDVGLSLDANQLQLALSLNYTHMPPGYSVALDPATRQLVLVALIDFTATSQDDFLRLTAGFLDLTPELRAHCAAPLAGTQPSTLVGTGALA